MKKFNMALASIVMICALAAPAALAHVSNPDFHSEIEPLSTTGVTEGVTISIAAGSDHVRLVNDSGKTVTVIGTEGEPYIRILPNGDVQVNENSVTYQDDLAAEAAEAAEEEGHSHEEGTGTTDDHAHDEATGTTGDKGAEDHAHDEGTEPHDDSGTPPHEHPEGTPPHEHADESAGGTADAGAAGESGKSGPDWQTVDDVEKGAYEWRDSRVRYLGEDVPPQVTDESKETVVKDYVIPLDIGGQTVEAKGELTWKGDEESSSTLPFVGLGILALLAIGGGFYLSRRRKREGGDGPEGSAAG